MNSRVLSALATVVAMIVTLPLPAIAKENVLRVGPGYEYDTIQAAVHAARPGTTIQVYPAVYTEMVLVVKDNLRIVAQGPGVLLVPAVLEDDDHHLRSGAAFTVLADRVTIQGFEIEYALAPGQFGTSCQVAIYFEGSYNTIKKNHLFPRPGGGCLGVNAMSSRPERGGSNFNTIEQNVIEGSDIAIAIDANGPNSVNKGNVVRDNVIGIVGMTGIGIANGIGFEVSGNRLFGAGSGSCILVGPLYDTLVPQGGHAIVDNDISGCVDHGIKLYADPGTVMTHNRISGNAIRHVGAGGILLTGEGGTLDNNEVAWNTVWDAMGTGIRVAEGADNNRVMHNDVGKVPVGFLVGGDGNLLVGNTAEVLVATPFVDTGVGNKWRNTPEQPKR